ncbi:MAG: DmsE family decaheme c-type cytochrome [Betaproteobacteria bacterium]|nr:DmsE family decaheme c-type cytochrome [Betaproteobacteria bacterium]
MRVTPRRNLRVFGMLAATLLLLAGTSGALAQPVPGKASPEETCKQCHADYFSGYARSKHGTKADLRAPANNGGCLACHGDAALEHAAKGGGRGVGGVLGFNDKKVAAQAKSAVCLNCHQSGERMNWQSSVHATRDVSCSSCHKVHAAHDSVRDKVTQTETCYTCHKEQRVQMSRPSHHPVVEGKMSCSSCHNVHGDNPKQLVRASVVETCFTCHMEKRGPFVHNHPPVQEDCAICHQPHGTTISNLLKARPPFLCQECHSHTSHPSQASGLPTGRATSTSLMGSVARGCLNCHVNIHGSNSTQNSGTAGRFRR